MGHATDAESADLVRTLEDSRWLEAFEVPGVAVVQVRDGAVTSSEGFGTTDMANGVPVTGDTVFRVGSVSKSVTAWGVMRLVEQGRMDLDAPVDTYLTRWHLPDSAFDADGVTIGRLLSHTAGLNNQDYSPVTTRPIPSLEEALDGGSGQPGEREADDLRLTDEPGHEFSYSNGGYTLLQLAVEEVVDEPFAAYMHREVLEPLGMTRSSFEEQPVLTATTATGHTAGRRPTPAFLITEQASGGLSASANDLALFVAAGMTGPSGEVPGRGVVSPAGVDALFAPIPAQHGMETSLGYELETLSDGTEAAGHGGKNTGWLSQFTTLPDQGEGIVVLTNSDNSGAIGFASAMWTDSLGVGPHRTTQVLGDDLFYEFALIITVAAICGLLALGGGTLLVRGARAGRLAWVWSGADRPSLLGGVLRVAAVLAVLGATVAWWSYPARTTLATLAPLRTDLATAALLALCLATAAVALTRSRQAGVHTVRAAPPAARSFEGSS